MLLVYHSTIAAKADSCPGIGDEIATDRPDVTNSSVVVPTGSLQIENGMNFSARDRDRFVDGTNTRLRAGIANCLEFLVDLPTYLASVHGPGNSGLSDVTPALKWQISPVPGKVDLSAVFGVALPTGSVRIVGPGAQPYLQFPWSLELRSGWGLSGMFTEFFRPSDPASKLITEATFVIEKRVTERASLFVEYVGDYPQNGSSAQLLNWGGLYRLTPNQQVDFQSPWGSTTMLRVTSSGSDIRYVLMSCSRPGEAVPRSLCAIRKQPEVPSCQISVGIQAKRSASIGAARMLLFQTDPRGNKSIAGPVIPKGC